MELGTEAGEDPSDTGKDLEGRSDDTQRLDLRGRTSERGSRRFWRDADPKFLKSLERHNARIGTLAQRTWARFFLLFAIGPFAYVLIRILFRVRVEGLNRLDQARMIAAQHFFEWDPLLTHCAMHWTRLVVRPWKMPYNLGGHFWVRTRLRRMVSLSVSLLGIRRGGGMDQGALRRATEILNAGGTLAIYPTGPTGRSVTYEVKPGVGYLSLNCPEVPVVPVAIIGLRDVELRDVLTLRRPQLTFIMGEPFRACDLPAEDNQQRVEVVRQRIEQAWQQAEAYVERTRAHAVPVPLPVLGFQADPLPELD
jgi:1-acyl-sn-glycerol-3-phosphate acyltransferase